MGNFFHFIPLFSFSILFSVPQIMAATNSITHLQSLRENQTLVSKNGDFELGFSTFGNSSNRYLSIWYKKIPVKTVVWVANREKPITHMSVALIINNSALVLTQRNNSVLWSITPSRKAQNPVLQLLDSGNLVLREEHGDEDQENYLWQSFDYPGDTLLPGMKLGKDLRAGLDRRLRAWKNENDPSQGNFSFGMDITNWPEPMQRIGSEKQCRAGPWNGLRYSGRPTTKPNLVFKFVYFSDDNEVYYMLRLVNSSVKARMVLNQTTNTREQLGWIEGKWRRYIPRPTDFCDGYGACGPNGNCDESNLLAVCDCLRGFKPKSPQEWSGMSYGGGCVRDRPLNCKGGGDGFVKYVRMKVPDTENSWLNQSMTLVECRGKCLRNCSCMAYTNSDIRGKGNGCVMWFGDLKDLRVEPDAGQDLYVRVPASELETNNGRKVKIGIAVGASVATSCGLLSVLYFIYIRRTATVEMMDHFNEEHDEDPELPLFDLSIIAKATDNFSINNKLGEGGFGPVYKGTLENGQEIAVKRLSRGSGQGLKEFKNEIALIAKLQHRNVVQLHGCCIQNEDKLIVYEYMPNRSLDFFLFDQTQKILLDWSKHFRIICGIARGLLYLHQNSRIKIIHRDLKASNILLDDEMNPKISDFGLARILGGDQSVETTHGVVGTYGYMAPEYAIDGNFSVKSDVFSFGVLLLEILSGKKNIGNHHPKDSTNLIGYAWGLWTQGRPIKLIGKYLKDTCNHSEALRCIHISLLCLQQHPHDRPCMSSVVMMLGSEIDLPQPKQPALFVGEYSYQDLSTTVLEAR